MVVFSWAWRVGITTHKKTTPKTATFFTLCFAVLSIAASPLEIRRFDFCPGVATLRVLGNGVQAVRDDKEAKGWNVAECRGSRKEKEAKSVFGRQKCVKNRTVERISGEQFHFRPERFINC